MALALSHQWGYSRAQTACERKIAAMAAESVSEKQTDDKRQAEAGRMDRAAIAREAARLARLMRESEAENENDGRTCIELVDSVRLREHFNAVFPADTVPAGSERDDAGADSGGAADNR